MGTWHARYAQREGAKVALVVDRDASAARRLAGRFGARAAAPSEDWTAVGQLDVVHVCTPQSTHVELARRALEAGLHAIVEKPVASDPATAQELAALAAQSGRLLVPVHQFPFQRGFRSLRAELGTLGTLRSVEFVTFTAGAARAQGARRRGVILEIVPHVVSLLRALNFTIAPGALAVDRFSDDVLELSAHVGPTRLSARIDLCARPTCNELRVAADGGTALADLFHGFAVLDRAAATRASKMLRPFRASAQTLFAASGNLLERAVRREPAYPGLRELIGATYTAIRRGGQPPIAPEEYVEAAALNELLA